MGLFDMFGAGGGTLTMVAQSTQVAPGQMVAGTVTFTGGKRQQNITNIKVRFVVETKPMAEPGKPPPAGATKDVVPEQMVTGAFQAQPGTPHPFQFGFQLPPQMLPEVKGQTDYKILASADIPGEVDAHAVVDVQLVGGGAPMGMGMGMGAPPAMPTMGSAVMAQHPMGGMHPGKVVAMQNGMIGVDWDDAKLGQSTWVAPSAVQVAPMGKGMMQQMPPPMGKPSMVEIGSGVMAEHPKFGGWHPGRVVAMQNGMVGVDWADPKLGDSAWLQPHQVQAGK